MSHAFGPKWSEDDWYSDALAADLYALRSEKPNITLAEAIEALKGRWSADGVRHAWVERER